MSKLASTIAQRALLSLGVGMLAIAGSAMAAPTQPLQPVPAEREREILGRDPQLWRDRQPLLQAISHSLSYIETSKAAQDYPIAGISRDLVRRSLQRLQALVRQAESSQALQAVIAREFALYRAAGTDGKGRVEFTGYYQPIYPASRTRTAEFRYPLYRLPPDFENWDKPHPTRAELVGRDGLGTDSPIAGNELVWLRDRLDAFLVQVQGSAQLQLRDGSTLAVGFAGKTDRPYTSIGMELVRDGKFSRENLSLQRVLAHFRQHPEQLSEYLPRNQKYVFFRERESARPRGSLGVPVTAGRSIATDRSLMPPGAPALIRTQIPYVGEAGKLTKPTEHRYVLDQDTGSAIQGPGRADLFMGTGERARKRAGAIDWPGSLYYLLLESCP